MRTIEVVDADLDKYNEIWTKSQKVISALQKEKAEIEAQNKPASDEVAEAKVEIDDLLKVTEI